MYAGNMWSNMEFNLGRQTAPFGIKRMKKNTYKSEQNAILFFDKKTFFFSVRVKNWVNELLI